MGKLAVISDIHADINEFDDEALNLIAKYIKDSGATRLHMAGDMSNSFKGFTIPKILPIFRKYLPTTFNLGNHDMLNLKPTEIENNAINGFINLDYIDLNSNTVLVALNGWYDYQYAENPDGIIPDTTKVQLYKKMYWLDRLINREDSDINIDNEICGKLNLLLSNLREKNKRVIICTHFVPLREFVAYKPVWDEGAKTWNILNGMLGSKHLGEIINNYSDIVTDVGIKWHCRPIGYRFEWEYEYNWLLNHEISPERNLSIHKKTSTEFNADVKKHLDKVLDNAITYIYY